MSPIKVLPPDLVAKIAAGEVVERPASAVKELVENALDAGATAIRVEVQRGGLGSIRVTDNGGGISSAELELAVSRHATSKLAEFDDLYRIRTLGFRGEALASIAAVSHLEVLSRPRGVSAGHAIRVEGGHVTHREAAGCPEGTSVTVRHLFFNVPARQAFQRSPAGEVRQIVSLCNQLALAAPAVRLILELDGRVALRAPGGDLRQALAATYGPTAAARMLALPELEEEGVRVGGYCSGPEEHRNTRLYCTFVVNGRLVRSQMLSYAVTEAYHTLLPGGRYPVAAIHLAIPPDEVDVNVHPTKTEIRLRRDRLVFSLLRDAVRQALQDFAPIPDLQPSTLGSFGAGPAGPAGLNGGTDDGAAEPDAASGAMDGTPRDETERAGALQPALVEAAPPPPRQQTVLPPNGAGGSNGRHLRALGQVGLTYIIAEDASGVYLIDQHSAHERVLYEQLLHQGRGEAASAGTGGGAQPAGEATQLLLEPEAVALNAAQSAWLQEKGVALAELGLQLEPFGDTTWLLRSMPRSLAARGRARPLARALGDLIDGLLEHEYGHGPLHDQAMWAVACHSAVRAGDALAPEEMAALIAQLERCDMRRTCPHGRPTMIHLSHAQLAREFGRR
jgi:DNA mismatch repair protein MutL